MFIKHCAVLWWCEINQCSCIVFHPLNFFWTQLNSWYDLSWWRSTVFISFVYNVYSALQTSCSFLSVIHPSFTWHAVIILVITNLGVKLAASESVKARLTLWTLPDIAVSSYWYKIILLHPSEAKRCEQWSKKSHRSGNLEASPKAHVVNVALECRATKPSSLRCLPRVHQRSCYYKMNIIGC